MPEPELIETAKQLSPIVVAAIGAIAGLFSGVIGSLIAPWVHYFVEQRKALAANRIRRISEVRQLLDKANELDDIRNSSLWGFIDEHLSEIERKILFNDSIVIEMSSNGGSSLPGANHNKRAVSSMLARLEKEWKLN